MSVTVSHDVVVKCDKCGEYLNGTAEDNGESIAIDTDHNCEEAEANADDVECSNCGETMEYEIKGKKIIVTPCDCIKDDTPDADTEEAATIVIKLRQNLYELMVIAKGYIAQNKCTCDIAVNKPCHYCKFVDMIDKLENPL